MKKFKKSTLIKVLLVLIICLPIIRQGYMRFVLDKGIRFVDMRKHSNYSGEQKTLLAIENGLLYCDLNDGGALYCYDIRTKETHKLSQLDGELKRTENGILYITNQEIFQVVNNELSYLCEVPSNSRGIVEWREGLLYWLEKSEDDVWRIYGKKTSEDMQPEILFQTPLSVSSVAVLNDKLYFFSDEDGIYCKEMLSGNVECISNLYGLSYVSDDKYMIFSGYGEDAKCPYYEILPDGTVEKLTEESGSTESVFGDRLYYIHEDKINIFDLKNKVHAGAIEIESKDWERMEVTDTGMFIREHPQGHIWYLDFSSGVFEKIIEQ